MNATSKPIVMSEPDFQRECSDFVGREVIYCVSTLVSGLLKAKDLLNFAEDFGMSEDDLFALSGRENYEEPVRDWLRDNWDRHDALEYLNRKDDGDKLKGTKTTRLLDLAVKTMKDDDALRDFANDNDIESFYDEVYEHWIVSGWLADKLEAAGEIVVRDFLGLTIWGRTCTGQGIAQDSVIRGIAREVLDIESDGKYGG